jgi:hypothetical protein
MKTAHERQEEKKQEKLKLMKQQVEAGTLVVRKMTAKERSQLPPSRPAKGKRKRSRGDDADS